jgi:hypothetical protein
MGNLPTIPSCVECMEDDAFPRTHVNPDSNGGMCDSVNMQALPPNSTNGGTCVQIPITAESTEDTVQVSSMKPLGITLCDSDTVKGVFVTGLKAEGNVAKLSLTVSVGMLLQELNGVDVTESTLDTVIQKIADSPAEKRLVLKFCGTKPVDTATPVATVESDTTSLPPPPPPAVSVPEKKKAEEVEVKADKKGGVEEVQSATITATATASNPSNSSPHRREQEKEPEEGPEETTTAPVPAVSVATEQAEGEKKTSQVQEGEGGATREVKQQLEKETTFDSPEKEPPVGTPEEEGGQSPLQSSQSSQSLATVDMTSPSPMPLKDLSAEFTNVSLSEEEEKDFSATSATARSSSSDRDAPPAKKEEEEEVVQEGADTTTPAPSPVVSLPPPSPPSSPSCSEELLTCHHCSKNLPRDSFTHSQLKKKAKRKCKECK